MAQKVPLCCWTCDGSLIPTSHHLSTTAHWRGCQLGEELLFPGCLKPEGSAGTQAHEKSWLSYLPSRDWIIFGMSIGMRYKLLGPPFWKIIKWDTCSGWFLCDVSGIQMLKSWKSSDFLLECSLMASTWADGHPASAWKCPVTKDALHHSTRQTIPEAEACSFFYRAGSPLDVEKQPLHCTECSLSRLKNMPTFLTIPQRALFPDPLPSSWTILSLPCPS